MDQHNGAEAVGQRLSLRIDKVDCPGMVIAYYPKTQKHRVRFDDEQGREKNLRLKDWSVHWVDSASSSSGSDSGGVNSLELSIRRDAAGRRLEVYNSVRRKWFQGTILKYVNHCQQHAVEVEPQGKVHMVDLTQPGLVWRYTDLVGSQDKPESTTLDVSKYRGVQRCTQHSWKAFYQPDTYVGCFATEKDAALAYDVYARKRGTPVNFDDRRICRRVMKSLRIPEPEEEPEQAQSLVSDESTSITTSIEPTATNEAPAPVLEQTPDAVLVKQPDNHQEDSDATPGLEMEETELESMNQETSGSKVKEQLATAHSSLHPPPESTKVRRRISVDEDEEEEEYDNNVKPGISAKQAAAKVRAELRDEDSEAEFEFEDEEDSDDEEFTSSSSESEENNDDDLVLSPRKTRGRTSRRKKRPENLFDDSDDVEVNHTRMGKKKERKRALQEIQSYNAPPKRKSEKPSLRKRNRALWPVGTRFVKEFPDFGTFEGRITEWDGKHYHVYYSEDEDQEELSEKEFDNYEIVFVPGDSKGKLIAQQKKRRRESRRKRARLA